MREGLTYKKLKDIGVVITGNTPSTKDKENYSSDDYCFVKPSDIAKDGVSIIKDSESYISEKGYNSSRKLPKGSVLTTCIGIIGKVGILEIDATCNQQINAIIPFRTILPKYLALAILSVKSQLEAMANAPVVPIINKGDFSNVEIPVPSFEEQERIVAELDLLTEIIDKQKQQLKELDNLAQSIFYDMFGNPVENEKGWNIEPLGMLCDVYRGASPRPIEKFLGGLIPWIKIGDATQGDDIYLHKTKEHIIEEGLKKTRYIHSGSLIFANCGVSLGFARIITFDGCIHDGWLAFDNIKDSMDKVFLLKSLNFCTPHFRRIAPDGTQPNLNTAIMKSFKQIVPPIDVQKKFVEKVKCIESQKQSINRSIAESQKLFDYTMDKYFG